MTFETINKMLGKNSGLTYGLDNVNISVLVALYNNKTKKIKNKETGCVNSLYGENQSAFCK